MSKIEEIEEAVRDRNATLARAGISKFLKHGGAGSERIFLACDWYRRLGLYREGFRLVVPEASRSGTSPAGPAGERRLLWAARFLNLMGSPEFALPLLSRVTLETADDHWIAGNIHLVNFEPASALRHFARMEQLTPGDLTYQNRLRRLGLADALSGLQRFAEAAAVAESIVSSSREPLLLGIAHQAWGEYEARAGAHRSALSRLLKAKTYFPATDRSADTAFLFKWLGFAYGSCGEESLARRYLDASEKRMRALRMRPEAWLDVYRLRRELGFLKDHESRLLAHYPGLSAGFRALLGGEPETQFGESEATFEIDLGSGEYRERQALYIGLPQEIRLLAWVRLTGNWGLDALKAKGLLWGGEVHSYLQLDARLAQLLGRLRRERRVPVAFSQGVITIPTPASKSVTVKVGGDHRPSFLQAHRRFRAAQMKEHYELGRSQRAETLRKWQARGWIAVQGKGRASRYLVLKRIR